MNQNFKLTGAPNFRDLGGLPTTTGRKVRFHRLLRSDHLGALHRRLPSIAPRPEDEAERH